MKKISENSGRNKIDGFEEYSLRRKKRAIWTAAGCVLAALMVVGISFALRSQGRALANDALAQEAYANAGGNVINEVAQDQVTTVPGDQEGEVTPGSGTDVTTDTDNPNPGDKGDTDNTGSGDTDTDNTGSGDTDTDNTGSGDTDTDNTGSGDTDTDNTGSGNTNTQPTGPQDISGYVKSVVFKTLDGNWTVKDPDADGKYHFNSDDSVRASIMCEDIDVNLIGNRVYIRLSESIPFPKEMFEKTVEFTGLAGNQKLYAGTYWLSKNDGAPGELCAVFEFDSNYLKWVSDQKITKLDELFFEFEFTWNVQQANGQVTDKNFYIGDVVGTVSIKTEDKSSSLPQGSGYSANKYIEKTSYENGKMIITYAIDVTVSGHQDAAIVLSDKINRGTEFYDFSWTCTGNSGKHELDYVKLTKVSDTEKTITIGDTGVDEGQYKIRYKASFDMGELQKANVGLIENTVTGKDINPLTVQKYTNINLMNKSGEVTNVNTGEVMWTVIVNHGDPYTFVTDEKFTDTLPAGTKLDASTLKIIQYEWYDNGYGGYWKKTDEKIGWSYDENTTDGTTLITATLPKGTYKYEITYKTTQNVSLTAGEKTTVENKAEISGGIQHETSAKVELTPPVMKKTMGDVLTKSRQFYTKNNTKLQVCEIEWTVELASVKAYDEYTDEGVSWGAVPLLMSPDQINKIKVMCGQTPLVIKDDYEITAPNDKENFLFKIKFLKPQEDKVTIDYTCYADITNVAGNGFNAYNQFGNQFGKVEAGKWIDKKFQTQSTELFKYVKGSGIDEYNFYTDSKIAIGMNKTLNWVIVAKPYCVPDPNNPLEFEDTLPKGLSFVNGSLKITAEWDANNVIDPQYYQYQIVKDTNGNDVIKLTVDLAQKTVNGKDYGQYELERLVITYDTEITDLADGQSKDYINTVEWDGNTVDQKVTVTRDVIGKNGSFDADTGMLRYAVIINPDGADLNPGGNLLRVEDTLTDRGGLDFILDGVALYSLTNASDGSGKKVPGSKVADLQLLQDKPAGDGSANTYYYDDKTYTFTAFIPDNTGYALVYDYQVIGEPGNDVDVKNKATLYGGSNRYESTEESTKVLKYALQAGVSTKALLRLEKRDEDYYDTLLADAKFKVSRWDETDEGKWVEVSVYTTDEKGSVELFGLKPDILYKVEEIEAPDGYAINKEIRYFMFTADPAKVSIPNEVSVPDGVKNMTRDDVTIYQYGKGVQTSVMKWTDKRLGTADILVKKDWQDGSGEPITWDKGSLNFDLYRKTVSKDQIPGYVEGKTYIYELTEDDLKEIKDNYEGYKTSHEFVKDYTLDISESSNGEWELLIEDLEQTDEDGNVYQYYLVETSMGDGTLSDSDYWMGVKYENTSGTGQYQAEITVTNTIVSDYSLPETGAEGSWTDRIKGWFQERYQKIVNYFRKG